MAVNVSGWAKGTMLATPPAYFKYRDMLALHRLYMHITTAP